jgi:hypothetical protein
VHTELDLIGRGRGIGKAGFVVGVEDIEQIGAEFKPSAKARDCVSRPDIDRGGSVRANAPTGGIGP